MFWDLLLYVPTVVALFSIGLKIWFSSEQNWAYVLFFMACFFLITGFNRVFGSRLMLLPSSPRSLELKKEQLTLELYGGERIDLVKDVRYFSDYAGKSFGLTGMDVSGKRRQYVFHRGQFSAPSEFRDVTTALSVYK